MLTNLRFDETKGKAPGWFSVVIYHAVSHQASANIEETFDYTVTHLIHRDTVEQVVRQVLDPTYEALEEALC